MTDYIRRCKKEAIVETIKIIGKSILIVIGVMVGLFMFALGLGCCLRFLEPWLQSIDTILNALTLVLTILGILCIIGLGVIVIYDMYKENLKKCIERIKSEQIPGDKLEKVDN